MGGGYFPVRRIYCVGRNYAAHIREMGGNEREPPFFFQKPTDAIVANGADVPYPSATDDFQHEIELVLAIGGRGRGVSVADARKLVYGLAVGVDLTRRDLQLKARDTGRPWEPGKSFDASAPITPIQPLIGPSLLGQGRIWLTVNGVTKQDGKLEEMIWKCDEIISHLSMQYELMPGDLIFTGTPAGVGKLVAGDHVEGCVEGVAKLNFRVVPGSAP
jgi:fumarylpyruvate hydrolase